METMNNAREMAHEIVENARKPIDTLRAVAAELGITTGEVEAYVRKLQYRKEYNARPEVKAYRVMKQQQRLERERQIRDRIKQTNRVETLNQLVKTLPKGV